MRKRSWVTIIIIIAVIIFAIVLIKSRGNGISEQDAICIGENSELYVQLGCHSCEIQEQMFGENYKHLNVIDCFFEQETCIQKIAEGGRFYTPTWIINNEKYIGVQSIEKLKELTRC